MLKWLAFAQSCKPGHLNETKLFPIEIQITASNKQFRETKPSLFIFPVLPAA